MTRGKWQKDVVPQLSGAGFTVLPLDYGNFLPIQLLLKRSREKKLKWLLQEYTDQCKHRGFERPSIIGHSFGSYLITELMLKYSEVTFDRVILCGSIVRKNFPWKELCGKQVSAILNQYGGRDVWTRLVAWFVPGTGDSGSSGFDDVPQCLTQQGRPEFHHSDYFYELNYTENWVPFLLGQPPKQAIRQASGAADFRIWITRAALVFLLFVMMFLWYVTHPPVGTELHNPKDLETYVWIPSGEFVTRCSPDDDNCDDPQKLRKDFRVPIPDGFWLGQNEVKQGAYERVMSSFGYVNPSQHQGRDLPVEKVTLKQAQKYCSEIGGALPTEKQWEYAARAGGDELTPTEVLASAWTKGNVRDGQTKAVNTRPRNAWHLQNMLGNVWEWVMHSEADAYCALPLSIGLLRGGSFQDDTENVCISRRHTADPTRGFENAGFRCVWWHPAPGGPDESMLNHFLSRIRLLTNKLFNP